MNLQGTQHWPDAKEISTSECSLDDWSVGATPYYDG